MSTPNYRCSTTGNVGVLAFWLIGSWVLRYSTVTSLVPKPSLRSWSRPLGLQRQATGNQKEPDLFDYFDPLLSPHAYPNGISPNTKPLDAEDIPPVKTGYSGNPFGIDYMAQKRRGTEESSTSPTPSSSSSPPPPPPTKASDSKRSGDDVFGFFDPLSSPHMYPNGISSAPTNNNGPQELPVDDRYNPLRMNTAVMSGSSSKKKLGILLMDHGSRNAASNARLHHLAQLYQLTLDPPQVTTDGADPSASSSSRGDSQECHIVVKAAHMEIATPSIPDGIKALVDLGVDEIICHPYFLSPGRHVTEDIPRIVNQAIEDLSIKIPVITTEPLGHNTQLMIGAIHSSVRENSKLLQGQKVR